MSLKILLIVVFSSQVFSLSQTEREEIRRLYRDNPVIISKHYTNAKQNNPCETNAPAILGATKITPRILISTKTRNSLSVSVDGLNYFQVPALIKCKPQPEQSYGHRDAFYLMITAINGENYSFAEVIPLKAQRGETTSFELESTSKIRFFKKAYEDNLESLTVWFYESQYVDYFELCNTLKYQNTSLISLEVSNGRTEIGDFILRLDERQSVDLPGIIVCHMGNNDYFYIPDPERLLKNIGNKHEILKRVFETRQPIRNQRTFALEEYLV